MTNGMYNRNIVKKLKLKIKNCERCTIRLSEPELSRVPNRDESYSILNLPEINGRLYIIWGESFDECWMTMKLICEKIIMCG